MTLLEEIPELEWRYSVPEFRLLREPLDLKELLDALQTQKCLIWLATKEMFITYRDVIWNHVDDFMSWSFSVWRNKDVYNHTFRFYAKTHKVVEDSFLFRLRDENYDGLLFSHNEFPTAQFPFNASFIGNILGDNPSRYHEFREFVFSPKQSAVFAKQTAPVKLILTDCEIEDDGKLFCKTFRDRVGSFGSLSLQGSLPINGKHLSSLLTYLGTGLATLDKFKLEGVVVPLVDCPLLAQIDVNELCLKRCVLEDDGGSLVHAIASGSAAFTVLSVDGVLGACHGPQLSLSPNRVLHSFLLAVEDERCPIKHLRVGYPNFDVPLSLIDALRKNQKLESLCLCNPNIPTIFWKRLLDEISRHQSLKLLNFEHMWNFDPHKLVFLRKMLDLNRRIEISIDRDGSMKRDFQDIWEEDIVPKLCFNRFYRGVIELGTLVDESMKIKIFGACLIRHRSNQKRIALLMNFNADILVSLLPT